MAKHIKYEAGDAVRLLAVILCAPLAASCTCHVAVLLAVLLSPELNILTVSHSCLVSSMISTGHICCAFRFPAVSACEGQLWCSYYWGVVSTPKGRLTL